MSDSAYSAHKLHEMNNKRSYPHIDIDTTTTVNNNDQLLFERIKARRLDSLTSAVSSVHGITSAPRNSVEEISVSGEGITGVNTYQQHEFVYEMPSNNWTDVQWSSQTADAVSSFSPSHFSNGSDVSYDCESRASGFSDVSRNGIFSSQVKTNEILDTSGLSPPSCCIHKSSIDDFIEYYRWPTFDHCPLRGIGAL